MNYFQRTLTVLALSLTTFVPEGAFAYILPATSLMRQYVVSRRKFAIKDLTLDLELSFNEDSSDSQSFEGRFYFMDGGDMRMAVTDENGQTMLLVEHNKLRQTNAADRIFSKFPQKDIFVSLLFAGGEKNDQTLNRMASALKSNSIDLDKQSYYRFDGKVVQMVGAKPADKDASQIWIYKENGIPAFYKLNTTGFDNQNHLYEVFLRGWGSPETGNWFPAEIEYRCDGHHLVTISVQKAQKNTNLPASLFTTLQGQ